MDLTALVQALCSHFEATITRERQDELRVLSEAQKWDALAGAMIQDTENAIRGWLGGGDPKKEEELLKTYRAMTDLGAYAQLLKRKHEAKQKGDEFDTVLEYLSILQGGARRILEERIPMVRTALVENGLPVFQPISTLTEFSPHKQQG